MGKKAKYGPQVYRDLVDAGLSTREIAEMLGMSMPGVRHHLYRLGLKTKWARRWVKLNKSHEIRYEPTPEEIRRCAAEIREKWSDQTRRERAGVNNPMGCDYGRVYRAVRDARGCVKVSRLLLLIGGRSEGQWRTPKAWPHPLLLPGEGELPFISRQFQQDYWRASLRRPGSDSGETVEVWVWGDLTEDQAEKRLRVLWPRVNQHFKTVDDPGLSPIN